MELGLTLGDLVSSTPSDHSPSNHLGLGFNTTLSIGSIPTNTSNQQQQDEQLEEEEEKQAKTRNEKQSISSGHEFVQLDLLPHTPVVVSRTNPSSQIPFPWLPSENGSTSRSFDVNRLPDPPHAAAPADEDEAALSSSPPNSAASSFQMDLCIYSRGCKRDNNNSDGDAYYNDQRGGSSRASDEDDNVGSTRKKLRLSKEQSAFLEESFKEHSTLNPKQKLALAKQLNLRPRQVEVWFQNRRARTKLKQTEVDCEYLKRCCETLSEENRRLQKELQELRALKSSNSSPFFMQLPATTLTMCPSCEKVATNNNSTSTITTNTNTNTNTNASSAIIASPSSTSNSNSNSKPINGFVPSNKPRFYPFSHTTPS